MPTVELNDARCRKAAPIAGKVTEYADKKQRSLALRVSRPEVSALVKDLKGCGGPRHATFQGLA